MINYTVPMTMKVMTLASSLTSGNLTYGLVTRVSDLSNSFYQREFLVQWMSKLKI